MNSQPYVGIALLAVFALSLIVTVYGTIAKSKWGINLRSVACPNCGMQIGRLRVPNSGAQAMWGGHTCPNCRCEMDKWGRRIAGPV